MATCRHCGRTIVQHPSGTWIPRDGTTDTNPTGLYCQRLDNLRHDLVHEPMPAGLAGAPQLVVGHRPDRRPADSDGPDDAQRSA